MITSHSQAKQRVISFTWCTDFKIKLFQSVKSPIVPPATSSVEGPALPSQEKLSPGRGGQAPAGTVTAVPSSSETSTPQPIIYYGYDSNETVPTDMCLVGCIFYMGEYIKTDPCDQWTKVSTTINQINHHNSSFTPLFNVLNSKDWCMFKVLHVTAMLFSDY